MATVLVMEDEPNITFILETILSENGHNVITAANGAEGMNILNQGLVPEIALVDLSMPVMDGSTVIKKLKGNEKFKDIPIVIISGSMAGLDDFPKKDNYSALITKPFNLNDVVKTVDNLIN